MKEPEKQEESKPDFEKLATDLMWEVGLEYGAFSHIYDYELCKRVIAEIKEESFNFQSQLSSLKKENEEQRYNFDSARILINCINEYDIGEILPTKLVEEIESFLKDK